MLDLKQMFRRHAIPSRGVIHIGAHEGQELAAYRDLGCSPILLIEANPKVFARLAQIAQGPDIVLANVAIADARGSIDLHVTSFDMSSSILRLAKHKTVFPHITETEIIAVPALTLDELVEELGLEFDLFGLINIDVQGAELVALSGARRALASVDAVMAEINFEELYEHAVLAPELDAFLGEFGLTRMATAAPYHDSFGDAFYVKPGFRMTRPDPDAAPDPLYEAELARLRQTLEGYKSETLRLTEVAALQRASLDRIGRHPLYRAYRALRTLLRKLRSDSPPALQESTAVAATHLAPTSIQEQMHRFVVRLEEQVVTGDALTAILEWNPRSREAWLAQKATSVPPGSLVLDAGAGTCHLRRHFAHCTYRAHDFRRFEGYLDGSEGRYDRLDYVSDITCIPVEDGTFNVVVCSEVFEHVPDPLAALAELARTVKAGARLFLTAPLGAGLHQEPFHFYGGFTPHWWRMAAERVGLDVVSIEPNGTFLKLLAQECARAASTIESHRLHHGGHSAAFERLFGLLLPPYLFTLDELAPNPQFTVGYHVELRKPTHDERIAQLTRHVAEAPQDLDSRYDLVDALRAAGRHEEAIIAESQASAAGVDESEPLPGLAGCLYEAHMAAEPAAAERILRRALTTKPRFVPALLALAELLEKRGECDEALAQYESAMSRYPGAAVLWTRRSLLLLRRSLPAPPPRPPRAEAGRVTVATLGSNGRFANQLLQYGYLKLYAERYGLEAQAPDWIGRHLFGHDDPLPSGPFTRVFEEGDLFCRALLGGPSAPIFDRHDLWGYFCYHTSYLTPYRDRFRSLFRPVPALAELCSQALAALHRRGATIIAVHIRHGDFGQEASYGRYRRIPLDWYREWLANVWPRLDRPVLYLATDDPSVRSAFASYEPLTAEELWAPLPGAEFFLDFAVMAEANCLAVANSTFSFVASLLNARAEEFVRPDPEAGGLVPYDPWWASVQLPSG